jgi:hypothetical protein
MESDTGFGEAVLVLESIRVRLKCRHLSRVVAGLPATSIVFAPCQKFQGRWDKPGDDAG